MEIKRINIIFGWFWLLCGLLLGACLQFKMGSSQEWMVSHQRMLWKAFHTHASMLAIMNIVYGYSLEQVKLGNALKLTGGLLAIVGTVLFSGAFFLAGIQQDLVRIASWGTGCIILAIIILIFGLIKKS